MQSPTRSRSSSRRPSRSRVVTCSRAVALVLAAMVAALTLAAPSYASAGPDRIVQGTLLNRADNSSPVKGVDITVDSSNGTTYKGTTDANGRYKVTVPGADDGALTIKVDTSTLPKGVKLAPGQQNTKKIGKDNTTTLIAFSPALGPDNRKVESKFAQIPQVIYNGLLFGIVLALAALGLSMVFGTTGLTNFAHGELVTFGAVMTYLANRVWGLPMVVSIIFAVLMSAAFGWLNDSRLWRPLRRRGTGLIAMMIVSIGLQFFLRNIYQYFTGGRSLTYREYVTPQPHTFAGIDFTYRDIVLLVVSLLVLFAVTMALQYTRLGRATRAVSDNPALAASTGINVNRVISTVWIVGTALAGLGGAFLGFSQSVTYQLGAQVLLLIFAATCVGGLGSIWGAMLGSVIIGLFVELSTLVIPSELKYAGAFVLLVVVLLVRPQGLLGRAQRVG
jgi:neutral amino acid transport system permease protein